MAGTKVAARNAGDKRRQLGRPTRSGLQATVEYRSQPGQHLSAGTALPPHASLTAFGKPDIVVLNRGQKFRYAGFSSGNRRQDRYGSTITWVREAE